MATLALSLAGQFVGGALGGPIGATIGRALGALAGSAIDSALFAEPKAAKRRRRYPPAGLERRRADRRSFTAGSRLSGNIIWATELEKLAAEQQRRQGDQRAGGRSPALRRTSRWGCARARSARLGRIWADGQLLDTAGLTLRFYRGTETQRRDSLIEAKQGGDAPAYRGLCYIVFERLPLTAFGNRIPSISVELCRVVGELEPAITAVTVIPGATEFGYDPAPRVRLVSPGVTRSENTHQARDVADWTLSIDELMALCPNLEHVALVVAWFGDDLRGGQLRRRAAGRGGEAATWSAPTGRSREDRARRRACVEHQWRRAGLWRHAVRRGGARGDCRPQGARH